MKLRSSQFFLPIIPPEHNRTHLKEGRAPLFCLLFIWNRLGQSFPEAEHLGIGIPSELAAQTAKILHAVPDLLGVHLHWVQTGHQLCAPFRLILMEVSRGQHRGNTEEAMGIRLIQRTGQKVGKIKAVFAVILHPLQVAFSPADGFVVVVHIPVVTKGEIRDLHPEKNRVREHRLRFLDPLLQLRQLVPHG